MLGAVVQEEVCEGDRVGVDDHAQVHRITYGKGFFVHRYDTMTALGSLDIDSLNLVGGLKQEYA